MKIAIRYYTKSGNTLKLANAISKVIGVAALPVDQKLTEEVDILFLCNSLYWAGVDRHVKDFLKDPGAKIGKIVNISTAALAESTYPQMKKFAEKVKINISDEEFHCKGSFHSMHKGKPDTEDIQHVIEFTKKIIK